MAKQTEFGIVYELQPNPSKQAEILEQGGGIDLNQAETELIVGPWNRPDTDEQGHKLSPKKRVEKKQPQNDKSRGANGGDETDTKRSRQKLAADLSMSDWAAFVFITTGYMARCYLDQLKAIEVERQRQQPKKRGQKSTADTVLEGVYKDVPQDEPQELVIVHDTSQRYGAENGATGRGTTAKPDPKIAARLPKNTTTNRAGFPKKEL